MANLIECNLCSSCTFRLHRRRDTLEKQKLRFIEYPFRNPRHGNYGFRLEWRRLSAAYLARMEKAEVCLRFPEHRCWIIPWEEACPTHQCQDLP